MFNFPSSFWDLLVASSSYEINGRFGVNFFFFLKFRPSFFLLQSYYWPLLFLLSHSFSRKRRMGRTSVTLQVLSGCLLPRRSQEAGGWLIVLAPNSYPSWRQFRSGQEASGRLCPPARFTTSRVHYNLRYVPGKGNCVGILTVLPRLCGYLAGRAECHHCRPCLGLQLESGSIAKNSIKKSKRYSPNIQHLISFRLAIKILGKKTTKTHKVPEIFLETMIFFCLVGGGLAM